ncbi:hypothetical protein [Methylomonas sp. UP202]|uniref:hypothetical protein n=1 Tax=Methylomonas sp. UP202 TaxID=3040943 RepID=UPI0024794834|nr:hypothetical protein [Methylomonas sp. UP202]WGS85940.1 hypothetical protein QC632_23350 [Methylomonas sp. UP202]
MSTMKLVAFIDLLGTKESHKVSVNELLIQITSFAVSLADNALILDSDTSKIDHFSDCAYITTTTIDNRFFEFLQALRFKLLGEGLYFKCGVDLAEKNDHEQEPDIEHVFQNLGRSKREKINKVFSYRLFGREIVPAYLMHEELKGVGFSVSKAAEPKSNEYTVNSVYISEKALGGFVIFKDIKFNGKIAKSIIDTLPDDDAKDRDLVVGHDEHIDARNEYFDSYLKLISLKKSSSINCPSRELYFLTNVDNAKTELELIDQIVLSTRKSHFRDSNYVRYYLSIFVTLIKSSPFDFIWFDCRLKAWRGVPIIFQKLVLDRSFQLYLKEYKNYEIISLSLLSMILASIDRRRAVICLNMQKDELISCLDNDFLPKGFTCSDFLNSDEKSKPILKDIDFIHQLIVLADTEYEAIKRLFKLHSKSLIGKINSVPDFVLEARYKRRIESVLAALKV